MSDDASNGGTGPAAFNAGCQARIDGVSRRNNPYPPGSTEAGEWNRGWLDVDSHWGSAAKWPVMPLPYARWQAR